MLSGVYAGVICFVVVVVHCFYWFWYNHKCLFGMSPLWGLLPSRWIVVVRFLQGLSWVFTRVPPFWPIPISCKHSVTKGSKTNQCPSMCLSSNRCMTVACKWLSLQNFHGGLLFHKKLLLALIQFICLKLNHIRRRASQKPIENSPSKNSPITLLPSKISKRCEIPPEPLSPEASGKGTKKPWKHHCFFPSSGTGSKSKAQHGIFLLPKGVFECPCLTHSLLLEMLTGLHYWMIQSSKHSSRKSNLIFGQKNTNRPITMVSKWCHNPGGWNIYDCGSKPRTPRWPLKAF